MKQGQKFSDESIRWIKNNLLDGTHPRALARHYGVSLITILRIRDGDTYAGVRVDGEEALRPVLTIASAAPGSVVAERGAATVSVKPLTPEEELSLEVESLRLMGLGVDGNPLPKEVSLGGKAAGDLMEEAFGFRSLTGR